MRHSPKTCSQPFPYIPGYSILEQLYQGSRTVVYRAIQDAEKRSVVIKILRKEYPSFGELVQFRNQYSLTKNLNIPGIIRPISLEHYQNSYALVMEDMGGISLQQHTQQHSLTIPEILEIAIQLADILYDLCDARIIHKDIKPANILIHPKSKQIKLIDFSIASLLPKETPEIQNPNVLEGTLAYLAPEQTGRMNRGIDYRADFYALGVTLYKLLTGELPFQSDDPLELVHCHIAKKPKSITHFDQDNIPSVLSDIVMKLMAKNAEDRYQSALGLKQDLQQCLSQWQETGKIAQFELGKQDFSDRFIIPEKLYGREAEIQTLLKTFEDVSQGQIQLMLVAGFSGVGKTAVINEVHKPITRQHGYFIKGKYDQFNRNIPFSAFVQALRNLMIQLLGESDQKLEVWKTKILEAVGENGQVIIEVIPELERIIGQQPSVLDLSGNAAQNRFNLLFGKFISVFTTKEHPLVIFLDDLQWADSASLNLLKLLMEESEIESLLVLGAYRDNEVFPAHPLILTLNEIQKRCDPSDKVERDGNRHRPQGAPREKQGANVNTLTLTPLNEADIKQLVADTLFCSVKVAAPLSKLVYQKTQGNPFFTTQFLKGLYEDDWIQFERNKGNWQCNLVQVQQLALTDDIVEFMVGRLQKLSDSTQKILKLAACIGNQFDLETLAIVSEQSLENTATNLWEALQEGLVLPVSETYKFFQEIEGEVKPIQTIWIEYHFLHDRVQQAAYSLISEDQKQTTHLRIGKLLLKNTAIENLEDKIFEIVNQMNQGSALIKQPGEKLQLAQLNFRAGKKAKAATAYTSAFEYSEIACSLLEENYNRDDQLALSLYELSAETSYLTGNFIIAENLTNDILYNQEIDELKKVKACEIKIQVALAKNQLLEAIQIGLQFLSSLGIDLPENPSQIDIDAALSEIADKLSIEQIELLIDLPIMTDEKELASMRILSSLLNAAYLGLPNLLPIIIAKQVDLSITYGNMNVSPSAYANYGLILCSIIEDIELGYRFGNLALNLLNKIDSKAFYARTVEIVCLAVKHWKDPISSTLEPLLEAYKAGLESGDFESASFAACDYCAHSFVLGKNLIELEQEMFNYSGVIARLQQRMVLSLNKLHRQVVVNLIEKTDHPSVLKGEIYNEEEMLSIHQQDNDFSSLSLLNIDKLFLCYLFNDPGKATEIGKQVELYLEGIPGQVFIPIFYLYDALSWLSLYPNLEKTEQEKAMIRIVSHRIKMEKYSSHAATNYSHKLDLINAETYRVLDRKLEAMEMYDQAIAGAKTNEYLQEEALANELAAQFYIELGKYKIAVTYLKDAYYCYARWGALAKTNDLEQRYPNLLQPILKQPEKSLNAIETLAQIAAPNISIHSSVGVSLTSSSGSVNATLDFAAILKASQALSGTIKLDQLLHQLTQIILQNSGGDFCAIILPNREGVWSVAAVATPTTTELKSQPLTKNTNLPVNLIQYVKNTQEVIALNHLKTELAIIDEYLTQNQPASVLCLPLVNQRQLIGILYLQNQQTSDVFTHDRIVILNCLCTQAAISLENARLFRDHAFAEAQLQRSNEELLRATRLKDQFLATMSHELRTPLNAILGTTEGLQEEVFGSISEKQMNALTVIKQSGSHLLDLINDILDVTRIASGKMELNCSLMSVVPLCQSSLALIKPEALKKGIRLETKFAAHLPKIWADERRIRQVLLNLLENAVKFTRTGGCVTLKLSYQPSTLTDVPQLKPLNLKNSLRITVIDTGIGMTPENIQKLFEPFIQIDSALNRQYEGIGLGLALVKRIVELHGGQVGVTSEAGVGSCFTVDLPATESVFSSVELETESEDGFESDQPQTSPLILLAEDNEANLSTISNYLRAKGYRLLIAKNGEETMTLMESQTPDVIIMDIQMPKMDGIDAIKQIRLVPNWIKIPIIALTALAMSGDRDQCLAAGANMYLAKPVKLRQLVTTIQQLLASRSR